MIDHELKERFERDHKALTELMIAMAKLTEWKETFEKYVNGLSKDMKDMSKSINRGIGALVVAQIIILPVVFFFLFKFFNT